MNTPSATSARPRTSRPRWSSTGRRGTPRPIEPPRAGQPARGLAAAATCGSATRARARAARRSAGAECAQGRACVVPAISRNFDAEAAVNLLARPYHRFSARRYIKTMNDFSRAPRVLVVEDDEDIAQALQRSLRMEGYEVRAAGDGAGGAGERARVRARPGDPRPRPAEARRHRGRRALRADDDVPILILTARDALESRVEGLDSGADDYLVKPFERQELLARMRALLRRRPPRGSAPLRVGDLTLNADTHEVVRGERAVDLTQREFELLEYLMRNERIVDLAPAPARRGLGL